MEDYKKGYKKGTLLQEYFLNPHFLSLIHISEPTRPY